MRGYPDPSVVRAVLAGLAVGEAYGLPSSLAGEALPSLQPLELGGVAAYGAATEQALLLAEVLADNCGFNPEDFARRLAVNADVDNPVRLYSLATAEHVMLVRRGYNWTEARSLVASLEPPLDAVARSTPIPLFYTKERLVAEMAAAQVLATSLDRRASTAARSYALILYYTLRGLPPAEAVEEAATQTPRQGLRDALYAAVDAASQAPERATRILSQPGDPLARLLAASAASLLAAESRNPMDALKVAVAVAPSQAAHLAAAMAGALLAAAGYRLEQPRLEAEPRLAEAASRLAAANARCRGLNATEAHDSITA